MLIVPRPGPGSASGNTDAAIASTDSGIGSAPRRFLLGLLAMVIVVALTQVYVVIGWDLPDDSGAGAWVPELLGPPLFAVLIGFPLAVSAAVGWAWRGAAVLGVVFGVPAGSMIAVLVGDPVTRAIDPRSISLGEGTEGAAAMIIVGGSMALVIGVPLAGLVGWAAGAAIRRRSAGS